MEVAASCIAFVDFALKLTLAIGEYQKSVRNYPKALDELHAELGLIQENLENLVKLIKRQPDASYAHLANPKGPLKRCQDELEGLLNDIRKRSTPKKGKGRWRFWRHVRRLLWPLTETGIQSYLGVVQRYSGQFILAVNIDTNAGVAELREAERTSKYSKVLRWLSTIEFYKRHEILWQLRQHDTGTWMLKNLQYRMWVSDKFPGSVLWLNGIHGCGKSVLISMIIGDAILADKAKKGNVGSAFLYCHFDEPETTNGSAILRSILVQLLSQQMDKAEDMLKEFERRMNLGQGVPSDLDDLMGKILQASAFYDKATIILDALDECDIQVREKLISRLVKLPVDSNGRVKLLLSSRPELDIRELLLSEPEPKYQNTVNIISLSDEHQNLNRDLYSYVNGCFQTQRRLKKIQDPLRTEIITVILQRATFFQLVRSQLDQIQRCRSEESIQAVLADLPTDLNSTYARILKQIERQEDVKLAIHTFLWLATAKRVLSLGEVVESLSVTPTSMKLPTKLPILRETELIEICGSLVAHDERTDRFSLSHFSVKEFLTSDWISQNVDVSHFHIRKALAEEKLAVATLTYLSYQDFQRELPRAVPRPRHEAKLLEYSAGYWTEHAKALSLARARGDRGNDQLILLDDDDVASDHVYSLTEQLLLHSDYRGNYRTFLQVRLHSEPLEQSQNMTHVIKAYDPDLCPLYYPVLCGLTTTVERFVTQHPDWLDEPIGSYGTPLIIAVGQNDTAMIQCLLRLGADIDKACSTQLWNEIRPLYYAVYLSNFESTRLLIGEGADIDLGARYIDNHSKFSSPLLHSPAYWGNAKMMKALIDAGAQVCGGEDKGIRALQWAVHSVSLDTVKLVVESGCDLRLKAPSGKTALQQALELRNDDIIMYLLSKIQQRPAVEALDNVSAEELGWAQGKPWYPQLIQLLQNSLVRTESTSSSPSDVWQVYSILTRSLGLPRGIALVIMDYGEHWVKMNARREDEVVVRETTQDQAYVSLTASGPVRRVSFRTISHDQGFSSEPENHGKYSGSDTWFEAGVVHQGLTQSVDEQRRMRMLVQRNVCADSDWRTHLNDWVYTAPAPEMKEWFSSIKAADIVGLYPRAQFPGWANSVKEARMEMWCALV
ncbi:hypothetical protein EST38_g8592 [Candolleomyces aberdarensis]|uniref:NACHT domain-containing protein n=1 Tax=Candolleomyces aberdarensis TaxID=2316362 RepID=A0A4Q2DC38_9AGAR|nr:hypothetical protein EST38_g8592 [Candolleomyces aberdarensis]